MNIEQISVWVRAARPQTLAAAFAPVMVGASIAYKNHLLNPVTTTVALICAFLIQIGTNFANDYFDYVNGADTEERIGFERATAQGLITASQMKRAAIVTMAFAFFLGLYLVWHAGWVILVLGVLSIVFGFLYTGGPYPLGYNGLGDLFVLIFFGFAAVMGTYYVNALDWSIASFWASFAVGALAVNILVVNNLRDIEQDRLSGKNTLGVLLGENALRYEYLFMLLLAFAIPPHFYFQLDYGYIVLLPFISIPSAMRLLQDIWKMEDKRNLNRTLEKTAQFMVLFTILFSIGIILS